MIKYKNAEFLIKKGDNEKETRVWIKNVAVTAFFKKDDNGKFSFDRSSANSDYIPVVEEYLNLEEESEENLTKPSYKFTH